MLTPLPTQLSGAKFLAERNTALLADAPRVGKTGAAIMAADYRFARTILVVTTASGRAVWQRGFATWSTFGRKVQIATPKDKIKPDTDVVIVGWQSIADAKLRSQLLARRWDLLIADESHAAKSFEAKRTQALYGAPAGEEMVTSTSLAGKADAVWCLSGTPMPNSARDLYPMLRVLDPSRLKGEPDVSTFDAFSKRYCITKPVKIGHGYMARYVDVVIGGRNEAELASRLSGFMLLRTQADVGIRPPVYETMPLLVPKIDERDLDANRKAILEAIENDDTKSLDMHLGPLRRLTGEIKAKAVAEAVAEEFDCGLDKIVLAYWHKDVGDILEDALSKFGVVRIDGSSSADARGKAEAAFRDKARVFLAQIVAAGEAIDLSAAAELLFVETSFVPSHMRQMSDRITNITQARLTRVRVATLANSIDDALQAALMRKWASIRKVLS